MAGFILKLKIYQKMAKDSSSSSGIGFTSLLTVLFIGLKLTHYIDWSWWWVLSPLWIPAALILAFYLIIGTLKAFGFFN